MTMFSQSRAVEAFPCVFYRLVSCLSKFGGDFMKDKEKIFKLLRESAETLQESLTVEEMIAKIE